MQRARRRSVAAGIAGLAVILLLCIGCYFLFKSMSKHMRKVREEFPAQEADEAATPQPPADRPAE